MPRKRPKRTFYRIAPDAMTEQQLRMQKMRDELNAPDPEDPRAFTPYKIITYIFVVFFQPYALYRIWCKKSPFNHRDKIVQTCVCALILGCFIAIRLGLI